jgi:hypothetical protein
VLAALIMLVSTAVLEPAPARTRTLRRNVVPRSAAGTVAPRASIGTAPTTPPTTIDPHRLSAPLVIGNEQQPVELMRTKFDDGTGLLVYKAYPWKQSASPPNPMELCITMSVWPPPLKAPCVVDSDPAVLVPLVDLLPAVGYRSLRVVAALRSSGLKRVVAKGATETTELKLIDADPSNPHVLFAGTTADVVVTVEGRQDDGGAVTSLTRTSLVHEFDGLVTQETGTLPHGFSYEVRLFESGRPCVRYTWTGPSWSDVACYGLFDERQKLTFATMAQESWPSPSGMISIVRFMGSHRVARLETLNGAAITATFVEAGPNFYRLIIACVEGSSTTIIARDEAGREVARSDMLPTS